MASQFHSACRREKRTVVGPQGTAGAASSILIHRAAALHNRAQPSVHRDTPVGLSCTLLWPLAKKADSFWSAPKVRKRIGAHRRLPGKTHGNEATLGPNAAMTCRLGSHVTGGMSGDLDSFPLVSWPAEGGARWRPNAGDSRQRLVPPLLVPARWGVRRSAGRIPPDHARSHHRSCSRGWSACSLAGWRRHNPA